MENGCLFGQVGPKKALSTGLSISLFFLGGGSWRVGERTLCPSV